MKYFSKIGVFLILSFVLIGIFFFNHSSQTNLFGAWAPTGGGTYRLQSSVGTSNSSITLSSLKEPISNIPYTLSYLNTDKIYGTLDPQTSKSEFIVATGITQNSDGTATLTGVTRGLTRTPAGSTCTASTTLAQAHAAQSIFIISDSPCFFAEYMPLRTNATSSATLVFSSTTPPRLDAVAAQGTGTYIATTSEFASIAYVNAISIAGVSNGTETVKGVWEGATALESASSTILGSTGAGLVLQAQYATDTPTQSTASASKVVMSDLTGYIKQGWINLTQAFTWTGAHTFNNATTTIGSSSNLTIASSTPTYGFSLNVGGKSLFTGGVSIGTASTTMSNGTLVVSGLASTTNLTVSGTCTNCATNGYEKITTTSSTQWSSFETRDVTATCSGGKKVVGGGYAITSSDAGGDLLRVLKSYPDTATTWVSTFYCNSAGTCDEDGNSYAICVNQ